MALLSFLQHVPSLIFDMVNELVGIFSCRMEFEATLEKTFSRWESLRCLKFFEHIYVLNRVRFQFIGPDLSRLVQSSSNLSLLVRIDETYPDCMKCV